MQIMF